MAKFDRDLRTFETRVTFIRDIFSNRHTPLEIMAHSIQYKLDKSYEMQLADVLKSVWTLNGQDPMKILKRVDSDGKDI